MSYSYFIDKPHNGEGKGKSIRYARLTGAGSKPCGHNSYSNGKQWGEIERQTIITALAHAAGHIRRAGTALGLRQATVNRKMKKSGTSRGRLLTWQASGRNAT